MTTLLDRVLSRRGRGLGRLRSLLRGPYPVTLVRARTRDGIDLALDPESWLDRIILRDGYYEREVLDAVLAHLPAQGVFWDVGANLGLHSLSVKRLRPDTACIAFEPVPFTAARLSLNGQLSGLEVQLLPVALGESSGYGPMSVSIKQNSGLSSLRPWPNISYESAFMCRIERADKLIAASVVRTPNVVKIDVEGYELAALSGMKEILASDQLNAIIFESNGEMLDEIAAMLGEHGFLVKPLHGADGAGRESANYLATRSAGPRPATLPT